MQEEKVIELLGSEIPVEINITGWLSSSWIWVLVVCIIGAIFIGIIATLLVAPYYIDKFLSLFMNEDQKFYLCIFVLLIIVAIHAFATL